MSANVYGALDRVAKAGDTMTGTLVLTGSPAVQVPASAAAGYVLTSDASGNASWAPFNTITGTATLKDATPPGSNPTAGVFLYSQSGTAVPAKIRDTSGNVRGVVDAFAQATANQTSTATSQTASTYLTLAVEASATYLMELALVFSESSTSGIFTPSWTGPAGATMQWCDTGTSGDYSSTLGATNNSYTGSVATRLAFFKGILTITTAGTLTFTFATNATFTATVFSGSYLRLTRVK